MRPEDARQQRRRAHETRKGDILESVRNTTGALTRRGFLKTTAAAALVAGGVSAAGFAALTPKTASAQSDEKICTTYCNACMGCPLEAVVRDGNVVLTRAKEIEGRAHRPEAHVRPRRLHPHAHRAGEAHPVPHEARRGHRAWRRSVGAHQLGRGHRHHLYEDQGVPGRIRLGQRVLLHLRHYRASQHVQPQPFGERGPVLAPEPHHRLRAHAGHHVHGGRLLLSGRRRHGSRLPNEHLRRVGPQPHRVLAQRLALHRRRD